MNVISDSCKITSDKILLKYKYLNINEGSIQRLIQHIYLFFFSEFIHQSHFKINLGLIV